MKALLNNIGKKRICLKVIILTLLLLISIPIADAFAETYTTIGGTIIDGVQEPLSINVGSDGTIGAYLWQDTSYVKQYFSGTAWGSNLFFNVDDSQKHYNTTYYTRQSNSGISLGTGTTSISDDLRTVVTVWNLEGSSLSFTQTIRYSAGEEYFEKEWKIENLTDDESLTDKTYSSLKFFHGGDTYFGGYDSAMSYWNSLMNMVYVKNSDMSNFGLMGFSGNNNSPADKYFGGDYYTGFNYAIGGDLPNTADSSYVDAGYQLQWNRDSLRPGDVWTINGTERWTPAGYVQVIAPSPKTVAPGSTVSYEFTVQNFKTSPDTYDVKVVSSREWQVSIRGENSITVEGNGAVKTVIVDLVVPSDAVGTDTITVTATSQLDETTSNSGSLITTIDPELKAITGVTINPSSIVSGQQNYVFINVETNNVTTGAAVSVELMDENKLSLSPTITGSGIVTSGSAIITLSVPSTLESGSYYIKVKVEGVDGAYDTAQLIIVEAPLNTVATLSDLKVNGTMITDFAPGTFIYNVELVAGTTDVPIVTEEVTDTGKASVTVTNAESLPGTTTILVTAEDGTTQKTYTINFTVEVPLNTIATLSDLKVNGTMITDFAPGTFIYNVELVAGTTDVPIVTEEVTDTGKASVTVTNAENLPGTTTILVTAEDGITQKTYTINFTVEVPLNTIATLSDLKVNGTIITGFAPGKSIYNVELEAGTTDVPTVSAEVTDMGKANGIVTNAESLPGTTTILVTAEDGTTQKTYTINFTVTANQDQVVVTGLAGVAPSSSILNDGKITGTTTAMEYKLATAEDSEYNVCTETKTIGLTAGDYVVRYVAKTGYNAGPFVTISVPSHKSSSHSRILTTNTGANIFVNGINASAGNTINTTENNKTVTTVVIDDESIEKKLNSEGNNSVVTISVSTGSNIVRSEFNGQIVKNMEEKQSIIEIKTDSAYYRIPTKQINIDAISEQFGTQIELKDIKVEIEIITPNQEQVTAFENDVINGKYTIVAPLVEFNIICTYEDKIINVSKFNNYVERTIAITEGIDLENITTGIVLNSDGTVRHVPTKIELIDGKWYAQINSLTNSLYAVIWNPLEFTDVAQHWAKEAVNDMGSRMIISGTGNNAFEPDRDITRAEFATIVVRALGLEPEIGENNFNDVDDEEWFNDYINSANSYNIISGYGNGQFGPTDMITREQAMTIIARATKITGLKTELTETEINNLLDSFEDSSQISDYAKENIAACLKAGIVSGRDGNLIACQDNITRAEVATVVRNMLIESELINK
ncbi:MAG: S-layer homology domain-containing protein [Sedimentibacter sp.]